MGLLVHLLLLSLFSCSFTSAQKTQKIGVNYGQLGNNLPSAHESVHLVKSMEASSVKIYDVNPEILRALSGTGLRVSVMVPNNLIYSFASNQSAVDTWILSNVVPFYFSGTLIRYLLVGNEITSIAGDAQILIDLVPAIRRVRASLKNHGLRKVKVGTSVAMDALQSSIPPSNGTFRPDLTGPVFKPLLQFLNRTDSLFFLDAYPYFAWASDHSEIDLNYALLGPTNRTYKDPGSGFIYTNLLDQMLDAVHSAMSKLGFPCVRIAIAETGWPSKGDLDQIGGSLYNAATYNRNAVRKLMSRAGTPARKEARLRPAFIFALYNENQKTGPTTERNFGLNYPNKSAVYHIDLTGKKPDSEYKPLPKPNNNVPYNGSIWCVPVKGANRTALAGAMSWACTRGNRTCDPIMSNGACSRLRLSGRAGYAFSSYWVQFRSSGGSCNFDGLAHQITKDPSHGSCKFPSVIP